MPSPNLLNLNTIIGKTVGAASISSWTTLVLNDVDSNKLFRCNTLLAVNISNSEAFISASINGTIFLIKDALLPVGSTLVIISKDNQIYLEEGFSIQTKADAANKVEVVSSYEELS
jgi:hypothetical protein